MVKIIYPKCRTRTHFKELNVGDFFVDDDYRELYIKISSVDALNIETKNVFGFGDSEYAYRNTYYPVDVEIKIISD